LIEIVGIPSAEAAAPADNEPKTKRHFSAAARAKMRRAQRARLAKIKAEKNAK
jgi:hypothetical protein